MFRRLVGVADAGVLPDSAIKVYLDDACSELTADFTPSPVTDFDNLVTQYHPETIYKAAINYWWNQLAIASAKHSQAAGQVTQNVGERFDRIMQMIDKLQAYYDEIESLGIDITMGNLSYWSRGSMRRIGGQSEEDTASGLE